MLNDLTSHNSVLSEDVDLDVNVEEGLFGERISMIPRSLFFEEILAIVLKCRCLRNPFSRLLNQPPTQVPTVEYLMFSITCTPPLFVPNPATNHASTRERLDFELNKQSCTVDVGPLCLSMWRLWSFADGL
jgi:hypothetical protein